MSNARGWNDLAVRNLWAAAILRAIEDLGLCLHRKSAIAWLLGKDSDLAFAATGLNPDSVRKAVRLKIWQQVESPKCA